jgi:hypothetical protein
VLSYVVPVQGGDIMPRDAVQLSNVAQVEDAFARLFDQIDGSINHYVQSTSNGMLKKQALQNTVDMLQILKAMYQKDLQQRLP